MALAGDDRRRRRRSQPLPPGLINTVLPNEIIMEIFRCVGDEKADRDAASLVCRRWRELERATRRSVRIGASGAGADSIAAAVALVFPGLVEVGADERLQSMDPPAASTSSKGYSSPQALGSAKRRGKMKASTYATEFGDQIVDLMKHSLSDAGLKDLAMECKGLEKLSLVWCSAITSTGMKAVAENCKNLKSLDIQGCYVGDDGLIAIGNGCKHLNQLNLRFCDAMTDEGFLSLLQTSGCTLVSLGISNCSWVAEKSVQAVATHCPILETLCLDSEYINTEDIILIAKGCRCLKSLRLHCVKIGDEALEAVGSYSNSLEHLTLKRFGRFTDRSLSAIAKGCKKLKDLILLDCLMLTDRSLEFVARGCANLSCLEINNCRNVETAALEYIGQCCQGLQELVLFYCPSLRNSGFAEIGRNCRNLRSLRLVDCTSIDDDAICHIAEGCRNLKQLHLKRCYQIGAKGITSVGKNCKLISDLSLEFCEKVTDGSLAAVAQGCHLQKLNLCGCSIITDVGVAAIARESPDLWFLDISVLQNVGDMALMELGDGCPKLKDVALSHSKTISDVGLGYLVSGCSQIESLQMVYCPLISSAGVASVLAVSSRIKKILVEESKVSERTRRRAGSVLNFLCVGL